MSDETEIGLVSRVLQIEYVDNRIPPACYGITWCESNRSETQNLKTRYFGLPFGASGVGGKQATALTYVDPALRIDSGLNCADEGSDLCHEMAVESLEAERISWSVGELTPRT